MTSNNVAHSINELKLYVAYLIEERLAVNQKLDQTMNESRGTRNNITNSSKQRNNNPVITSKGIEIMIEDERRRILSRRAHLALGRNPY